jgi:hypothetical protein
MTVSKFHGMTWREVIKTIPAGKQNEAKREAIDRMLGAHSDWSNRRIANAIYILVLTEDDLDQPVGRLS